MAIGNQAASPMSCIATVIVTYNPDLAALELVFEDHAHTDAAQFVVVDNASVAGEEVEKMATRLLPVDRVTVLRQTSNAGLGAALNLGIEHARRINCSHVALFDQDSRVNPDTLKCLREGLEALQARGLNVAVVGPSQVDLRTGAEYPQRRIQGASMAMIWPSKQTDEAIEVSFLITSGSLIEVKTFDRVGTMRADFFIDYIDIEWCFRAAAHGLRSYCIRSTTIRHALGDQRRKFLGREVSVHSPLRQYYMFRNVLVLARMPMIPLRYRVFETLYFLAIAPVFLILAGFSSDHLRMICLGIAHGLTRRLGPLNR